MASPLLRSNIVIFLISMSLVLLLGAGLYASNRLTTQWLLVGSLEQTYSSKQMAVSNILKTLPVAAGNDDLPDTLTGLRLSLPVETENGLSADQKTRIAAELEPENGSSKILEVFKIMPDQIADGSISQLLAAPQSASATDLSLLPRTMKKVKMELTQADEVVAVPNTSTLGDFSSLAVIVFPAATPTDAALLAFVDTSALMKTLRPLLWSISAAIGALCFASFLFAGILLWMRFRDQLRTNRNIQYLAHHDTLTGLPNRAVFNARLTESLRLAQAKASNIGVMLIDVDKFKEINDTHGHGIGDVFLQIVAERLKAVFSGHLVARLSGDEFAVMLTSISDAARMTRLATDLMSSTETPCSIDGRDIKISLSIGLARASDGSWRSSRLLHCADLALYRAKHSGRSTFSWYTPELDSEAQKRKEIEDGLIKALKFDQFKLLYQPQIALMDGSLKGYEALIRWDHPTKGRIRPDIFIPVAEDNGIIADIGNWVLNHACHEAALWPDQTRRVAVNMSPAQFVAGETQKRVAQALQNSKLDPKRLEIEITESLLISNTDAVIDTLRQIRDMGVSIAMDDFGTGYSSLSYLSLFPFDKIKIDKAFIQNLGSDASTDAIVTSIVGLGRSLDVLITAEGVETAEQAVLLKAAGCDLVQGYFYGKPDDISVHENNLPTYSAVKSGVSIPLPRRAFEQETASGTLTELSPAPQPEAVRKQTTAPDKTLHDVRMSSTG